MCVVIQMLEKYFCKGRNERCYSQFNTVHPLWALVLDFYSATSMAHTSRYSLKSHWISVLHMYEGSMQLALMEVFAKDMNWRIPEDLGFNKPVNYLVVNYILNHTKHYWVMPDTEAGRQRKQLMTVAYISVTYGYSLRG